MNQKRTFITLILIVSILALGVAYAAISNQTLVINGTASATASDANFDVKFTGTPTTGGKGTTTATLLTSDSKGRTATMTVTGLTTKGDTATATFTILNNTSTTADVDALLSASISGQTNTDWFEVTHDLTSGKTLAPGATTTMTVSVKLKDTIVGSNQSETFKVTITAKPQ